jgi:hypothetical protein
MSLELLARLTENREVWETLGTWQKILTEDNPLQLRADSRCKANC